jgi:hypothetical protein
MRGARQSAFSTLIRRINTHSSVSIRGRPPGGREDPYTLGVLAAIGIEKGKPFTPDDRLKKIRNCPGARGHFRQGPTF